MGAAAMSGETITALECLKTELDHWLQPENCGDAYELCKELRNVAACLRKNGGIEIA